MPSNEKFGGSRNESQEERLERLLLRFSHLLIRLKCRSDALPTGRPFPDHISRSDFVTKSLIVEMEVGGQRSTPIISFFIYDPPKESGYPQSIVLMDETERKNIGIRSVNFTKGHNAYLENAEDILVEMELFARAFEVSADKLP